MPMYAYVWDIRMLMYRIYVCLFVGYMYAYVCLRIGYTYAYV